MDKGSQPQRTSTAATKASTWHSSSASLRTFLHTHKVPVAVKRLVAQQPVEQYTQQVDLGVWVSTYNAGGRLPAHDIDLSAWLSNAVVADMVVIGIQEIVPLSASSIMMGGDTGAARVWLELIQRHLSLDKNAESKQADRQSAQRKNRKDSLGWQMLVHRQLVGVWLAIWVRQELVQAVQGVQTMSIPTGMLGLFGNKGAVAVRLRVHETGLVFICAHMSSGDKPGDDAKRNLEYNAIMERGVWSVDDLSVGDPNEARRLRACWGHAGPQTFIQHDHLVWLGDLNYRLSGAPDAVIRQAIASGEFKALTRHDELKKAQKSNYAFQGWNEGPLSFPPTYKFHVNSDKYTGSPGDIAMSPPSTSSSVAEGLNALPNNMNPNAVISALDVTERGPAGALKVPLQGPAGAIAAPVVGGPNEKVRTPAWTDRILWRSRALEVASTPAAASFRPQLHEYLCAPIRMSDHRPVLATMTVPVLQFEEETAMAMVMAAQKQADLEENAKVPKCELIEHTLDLGILQYNQALPVVAMLHNTGIVDAHIQLVPQDVSRFGEKVDAAKKSAASPARTGGGQHPPEPIMREVPLWLTVVDQEIDVGTGATRPFQLLACVSGKSGAAELAVAHGCRLECDLWLRVTDGNELYLTVKAEYQPSFVGLTPSTLLGLDRPLQECPTAKSSEAQSIPNQGAVGPSAGALAKDSQPPYSSSFDSAPLIDFRADREGALAASQVKPRAYAAAGNPFGSDDEDAHAEGDVLVGPTTRAGQYANGATELRQTDGWTKQGLLQKAAQPAVGVPQGQDADDVVLPPVGSTALLPDYDWGPARINNVPPEVMLLLTYLRGNLHQPGIFLGSSGLLPVLLAAQGTSGSPSGTPALRPPAAARPGTPDSPGPPDSATLAVELELLHLKAASVAPAMVVGVQMPIAVFELQQRLDQGRGIAEGTDPHIAASLLLLYYASLPQTLLPRGIAHFCENNLLQRAPAITLLNVLAKPPVLATFWASLCLFQEALQPDNATSSGLTYAAVAALLAELWLEPLPSRGDTQRQSARLADLALKRVQFMMMMLMGQEEASLI